MKSFIYGFINLHFNKSYIKIFRNYWIIQKYWHCVSRVDIFINMQYIREILLFNAKVKNFNVHIIMVIIGSMFAFWLLEWLAFLYLFLEIINLS